MEIFHKRMSTAHLIVIKNLNDNSIQIVFFFFKHKGVITVRYIICILYICIMHMHITFTTTILLSNRRRCSKIIIITVEMYITLQTDLTTKTDTDRVDNYTLCNENNRPEHSPHDQ